jgi:RNA polymerase sigma-70 factor (ECF subfamily)
MKKDAPTDQDDGDRRPDVADDSTSSSLLRRAARREADAWRRIVGLYTPLVRLWCRQARLPEQDVADVSQEIFSVVAARLDVFDAKRPGTSFRGWMRGIARNKLRDHFEGRGEKAAGGSEAAKRLQDVPSPAAIELSESPQVVADIYRRALNLVRDEFESRTWTAFWRLTVDGQPASKVAAELGISPNAARQAKSRVLRRLKRELGEVIEPPAPDGRREEPS